MRRSSRVPSAWLVAGVCAAAVAAWAAAGAGEKPKTPVPPYCQYEALLKDGRTIAGFAPARDLPFQAVTPGGEKVKISLNTSTDGKTGDWNWMIRFDAARKLYVVRSPGWTAELQTPWDTLTIPSAEMVAVPTEARPREPEPAAGLIERNPKAPAGTVLEGSDVREFRWKCIKLPAPKRK